VNSLFTIVEGRNPGYNVASIRKLNLNTMYFLSRVSTCAFQIIYDILAKVVWLNAEQKRYLILRHKFPVGGETDTIRFQPTISHPMHRLANARCWCWMLAVFDSIRAPPSLLHIP
jgi:hypothetical protein